MIDKFKLKAFIMAFLAVIIVAFLGNLFTDTGVWYESIKPDITPPGFVFSIVWSILYLFIAIAFYLVLRNRDSTLEIKYAFWFNLGLNIIWTVLFFQFQLVKAAFVDIVLLIISVLMIMSLSWKIEKKISFLLLPYLLWLCFAAALNYLIAFG